MQPPPQSKACCCGSGDLTTAPVVGGVVCAVALLAGWLSGLYRTTALFVNVDCQELEREGTQAALSSLQALFQAAQRVVRSNHNGVIKEFTRDDKGFVLVACFGLPPFFLPRSESHAVLAAMEVVEVLHELGFTGSVGLASGVTFCGAVGSAMRQCVGSAAACVCVCMCACTHLCTCALRL